MALFTNFLIFSLYTTFVLSANDQNGMEHKLHPVYLRQPNNLPIVGETGRNANFDAIYDAQKKISKTDSQGATTNTTQLSTQTENGQLISQTDTKPLSNVTNSPTKVVFVKVNRPPIVTMATNTQPPPYAAYQLPQTNFQQQQQLGGGIPTPSIISEPNKPTTNTAATNSQVITAGRETKYQTIYAPSSLTYPNTVQSNSFPPTNELTNRQLPIATSAQFNQQPPIRVIELQQQPVQQQPIPRQPIQQQQIQLQPNQQQPIQQQPIQRQSAQQLPVQTEAEDRSSYSWYTPQITKNSDPPTVGLRSENVYNNDNSDYNQEPQNGYGLQEDFSYDNVNDLADKMSTQDEKDEYRNGLAKFINGGVATIFGLALSLLLLAIIVASITGRKKREIVTPPESSTWEISDMIQCVSRFYCEMEQWDKKYPPPSKGMEQSKVSKVDNTSPKRRDCAKTYPKCPVSFTLLRTIWRMIR